MTTSRSEQPATAMRPCAVVGCTALTAHADGVCDWCRDDLCPRCQRRTAERPDRSDLCWECRLDLDGRPWHPPVADRGGVITITTQPACTWCGREGAEGGDWRGELCRRCQWESLGEAPENDDEPSMDDEPEEAP